MAPAEEFLALRDIFFVDLGGKLDVRTILSFCLSFFYYFRILPVSYRTVFDRRCFYHSFVLFFYFFFIIFGDKKIKDFYYENFIGEIL